MGLPVISTNWSGTTAFLDGDVGYPLPIAGGSRVARVLVRGCVLRERRAARAGSWFAASPGACGSRREARQRTCCVLFACVAMQRQAPVCHTQCEHRTLAKSDTAPCAVYYTLSPAAVLRTWAP